MPKTPEPPKRRRSIVSWESKTNELAQEKILATALALTSAQTRALFDVGVGEVLSKTFSEAHADEGTVWWLDEPIGALVPIWNNGPDADAFVGRFCQPLSAGLISMVLASEQPFVENAVPDCSGQDPRLDTELGVRTQALIAVPLLLFRRCLGVVSCVQLARSSPAPTPRAGYVGDDLRRVLKGVSLATRLLEHRVMNHALGWNH